MRTVTTKLFKFNELSEQAKESAREWYRNCMSDSFDVEADMISQSMFESAKEKGIKFSDTKYPVSWNLSYSQGDYVALNKSELETKKLIEVCMNALGENEKEVFKFLMDKEILYVTHTISNHHYYGQQVDVELELGCYDENELSEIIVDSFIDDNQDKIEQAIKDYVDEVCAELKRYGYKEIEYLYSDESVDEMLTINEYEFTEEGKHWK